MNQPAAVRKTDTMSPNSGLHRFSRKAHLEYLSEMLPQMRKMAIGLEEPTLVNLLEMAMMEAQLQLEIQNGVCEAG